MLKNEYLGAKIGVDTAENEPEKSQQLARFAEPNRASHWLLNSPVMDPLLLRVFGGIVSSRLYQRL